MPSRLKVAPPSGTDADVVVPELPGVGLKTRKPAGVPGFRLLIRAGWKPLAVDTAALELFPGRCIREVNTGESEDKSAGTLEELGLVAA
jgi:hypothetical protein